MNDPQKIPFRKKESDAAKSGVKKSIHDVLKLLSFLKMTRVNMWFFVLSILLSLGYSLSMTYSARLLFPLANGIIAHDFSAVRHLECVSHFVDHFPGLFESSTSLFILLVVMIYLVMILKNVFHYLASLTTQIQAKIATVRLRQFLIEKCFVFDKSFYDKNTIAYLQSVLAKSALMIETQFRLFQNFISEFMILIAFFLVMVLISWKLTLITLASFPAIHFFTQKLVRRIQNASRAYEKDSVNLNEKIFNVLYCMPVIKSFTKEERELREFSEASEKEIEHSFKMHKLESLARPVEDLGTMTGILCVALGLAAVTQVDPGFNPAKAFVFFYLSMRVIPGLNSFNTFSLGAARTAASLDDVEHVLGGNEGSIVPGGDVKFSGLQEGILFKDLSFRYSPEGPLVLDHVNFFLKKRSIVAIVGPSGSGKSTLVNLLLRFYDCPSGAVFLDGKDIRQYDIKSLRKAMGFVSQEVLLFNDTIRKNVLYGAERDIADNVLQDFGVKAQIHDFVEKMPHKYDTNVGERGARLSGGERQRLSIARALIKEPEILIMDEATSALDSETEKRIHDFLSTATGDKTMIIIAHRFSTIQKADIVVYLEKGRIVESGTLPELIDKKGAFYQQWQAQKL